MLKEEFLKGLYVWQRRFGTDVINRSDPWHARMGLNGNGRHYPCYVFSKANKLHFVDSSPDTKVRHRYIQDTPGQLVWPVHNVKPLV